MKNVNLRKYTLFIFVCFLSFFGLKEVSAVEIYPNRETTIIYGPNFTGLKCTGYDKLTAFNVKKKNTGDYVATLKSGVTKATTESFTCTYDTGVLDGITYKNGSIKYNLSYSGENVNVERTITTHLYRFYTTEYVVTNSVDQLDHIVSGKLTAGANLVDLICDITTCTLKLKENLSVSSKVEEANAKIVYVDSSGSEHTISVVAYVHGFFTVRANAGGYGKCDFGNGWSYNSAYGTYEYSYSNGTMTLPKCDTSNSANPYLEFKGWTSTNNAGYSVEGTAQSSGVCKGAIAANSAFTPNVKVGTYFSCYALKQGVGINTQGGTIDTKGWTQINGAYYKFTSDSVVLPVPSVPARYGTDGSFVGWKNSETGEIVKGNTAVPANNEVMYYAVYSANIPEEGLNTAIDLYINSTQTFALSSVKFDSCKSADSSYVAANFQNGQCLLTGMKVTSGVNVFATSGGKTYTVNVTVHSREGDAEGEDGKFVIDLSDNEVAFNDDIPAGEIITSCDSYFVKSGANFSRAVAYSSARSYNVRIGTYSATSHCDERLFQNKSYVALCLDPGRSGPTQTGNWYVKDRDADPSGDWSKANNDKKFDKAVFYISSQVAEIENLQATENNHKIAANIALRLLAVKYKQDDANTQKKYWSHYKAYEDVANANMNLDKWSSWDSTVKSLVKKFINEDNIKKVDGNQKITDEHEYDSENSTNSIIYFNGKITLPDNPENVTVTPVCSGKIVCNVLGTSLKGNVYSYTLLVNVSQEIPKKPEDVQLKVTYNSKYSIDNATIIRPAESKNIQRMVIFNPNRQNVAYIPFTVKGYAKCDLNEFMIGEDPNKPVQPFNQERFNDLNCCSYVADHDSYIYKNYCNTGCINNDFALACDVSSPNKVEGYVIEEGANKNGQKYSCIVDLSTSADRFKNTDEMTDQAGNKISLDAYSSNSVCRISCKEKWNITTAGFKNFTGELAVAAGSYFQMNRDAEPFIGATRTCVTTYIDVNDVKTQINSYTSDMLSAFNTYSEYYAVRLQMQKEANFTKENKTYYTYEYENKAAAVCGDKVAVRNTQYHRYSMSVSQCNSLAPGDANPALTEVVYTYDNDPSTLYDAPVGGTSGCTPGPSKTCYNYNYYTCKYYKYPSCNVVTKVNSHTCTVHTATIPSVSFTKYNTTTFEKGTGSTKAISNSTKFEVSDSTALTVGAKMYDNYTVKCQTNICQDGCGKNSAMHSAVPSTSDSHWQTIVENEYPQPELNFDSAVERMRSASSSIERVVNDLYECQNFYFSGTNKPAAYNMYSTIPGTAYEIKNSFDPKVTYNYEEAEYMTMIGEDNILVKDEKQNGGSLKNEQCRTSNGQTICNNKSELKAYSATGFNKNSYTGTEVSRNNIKSMSFLMCSGSSSHMDGGSAYTTPNCQTYSFNYIDANYFKATVTNSSFYRMKGAFYVKNNSDIKTHADNINAAVSKAGASGDNVNNWSILGGINTFPIKMTTRRNIYQYEFQFANIGVHSDGKTLGRIMGSKNSVVTYNTHACFYEVYESVCKCCGDPIDTEVVQDRPVDTKEWVIDGGYDYTFSNSVAISENGELNFSNSTVSLYDLNSDTNQKLGTNWSENSTFYVSGQKYTTNKGAELASAIEEKGENVYNETPEYSYTLTPAAISEIKDYNDRNGYELRSSNLELYGNKMFIDVSKNDHNEYPTFGHYGSKYLREKLKKYETSDYKNKLLTSRKDICQVKSGSQLDSTINSGKCRWIDYIEETKSGSFRLAYK